MQTDTVSGPRAFTYGGYVVDSQDQPITGVEVTATHEKGSRSLSYIDVVQTDARGHFQINRERAISGHYAADVKDGTIRLRFSHPNYTYVDSEDLRALSATEVSDLKVTLPEGRAVGGQVVDANGQPVVGALVEVTFASGHAERRGGTTDRNGRFTFRGLPSEAGTLHVLTMGRAEPMLTARADVQATQTNVGVVVATLVTLPAGIVVHELFGMKLIDVDASVQAAFHLSRAGGVVVLDPGSDGHGQDLQRGDQFVIVGDARVKDFADFAAQLLTLRTTPPAQLPSGVVSGDSVRVVWDFRRPDSAGWNTQYLKLDDADVAALTAIKQP